MAWCDVDRCHETTDLKLPPQYRVSGGWHPCPCYLVHHALPQRHPDLAQDFRVRRRVLGRAPTSPSRSRFGGARRQSALATARGRIVPRSLDLWARANAATSHWPQATSFNRALPTESLHGSGRWAARLRYSFGGQRSPLVGWSCGCDGFELGMRSMVVGPRSWASSALSHELRAVCQPQATGLKPQA